MKFIQTKILIFFLFFSYSAIAQDIPISFPESEEEIVKALKIPKIKTRAIRVVPRVGALISFDYNSTNILPEASLLLDNYVKAFKGELRDICFIISGHTDNIGSDQYNQKLSEKRAIAVKNYLTGRGVEKHRLYIKAFGEKRPIRDNSSEFGRKMNRRVEFEPISKVN